MAKKERFETIYSQGTIDVTRYSDRRELRVS